MTEQEKQLKKIADNLEIIRKELSGIRTQLIVMDRHYMRWDPFDVKDLAKETYPPFKEIVKTVENYSNGKKDGSENH